MVTPPLVIFASFIINLQTENTSRGFSFSFKAIADTIKAAENLKGEPMSILKDAIKMEIDGEKYYRNLAEMNKDNHLHGVFQKLADDEKDHAHVLKQKEEHQECTLKKSQTFQKASSAFQSLEEFKSEINEIPSQIDSYRFALEKEQESIDLYTDLKEKSESGGDKEIYDFLIEQEKDHYNTINSLIDFLTKSEDWVESAEFGVREKY